MTTEQGDMLQSPTHLDLCRIDFYCAMTRRLRYFAPFGQLEMLVKTTEHELLDRKRIDCPKAPLGGSELDPVVKSRIRCEN